MAVVGKSIGPAAESGFSTGDRVRTTTSRTDRVVVGTINHPDLGPMVQHRKVGPNGKPTGPTVSTTVNRMRRNGSSESSAGAAAPKTTPVAAKKEIRRSLAEQNALIPDPSQRGHVISHDDEKVVVSFPWHLRSVGFYDGMFTNTDLKLDYQTGGREVTVWLKKGRG